MVGYMTPQLAVEPRSVPAKPDICPDCGAAMANVQGMLACPECCWTRS